MKKPLLTEESIPEFLLFNYGIKADQVVKIDRGVMSSSYKVSSGDKHYFLKEPLNSISKKYIEDESCLLCFLRSKMIPVAEFMETTEGAHYVDCGDRLVTVQEFIDGNEYKAHKAPDELYLPSMEMLGKINAALKDYDLKIRRGWSKESCENYDENSIIQTLQACLSQIEELNLSDDRLARAKAVIQQTIEIQPRVKKYGAYQKYVTYSSTHGDYHVGNLIYHRTAGEEEIVGVVDCSSSCSMPVSYNLLRFYLRFDPRCARSNFVDTAKLIEGLKRYTIHAPLTYHDYRLMPYVYLHIVGRILMPLRIRRCINHIVHDNEDLARRELRGALWLIRMFRYLDNNAGRMSKELARHYKSTLCKEKLIMHKRFVSQFENQEDMKLLRKQEKIIASKRIFRILVPSPVRKLIKMVLPKRFRKILES